MGQKDRRRSGEHAALFHEGVDDLVGALVPRLAAALHAGHAVVVIARPERRAALEDGLGAAAGDARFLDAASTLARFLDDGRPDAGAFDAVVGETIRVAVGGGRPVTAYGEMVELLWDAGDVAAAVEVERLWNGLAERHAFALLCAYPVAAAGTDEVCGCHTGTSRRFDATESAPRLARRFVLDTLAGWSVDDGLVDDVVLVVSELSTNAVSHAATDFSVSLAREPGAVRVSVGDRSPVPPKVRSPGGDRPGGRGLHLVDALASGWGHEPLPGGKVVWAEFARAG